jgi:hypothetical protein
VSRECHESVTRCHTCQPRCQHRPGRSRRLPRPRTRVQRPSDAATRGREAGAWSGRASSRVSSTSRRLCWRSSAVLECHRGVIYVPVPLQSVAGVSWGVSCNQTPGSRVSPESHRVLRESPAFTATSTHTVDFVTSTRCIRARRVCMAESQPRRRSNVLTRLTRIVGTAHNTDRRKAQARQER